MLFSQVAAVHYVSPFGLLIQETRGIGKGLNCMGLRRVKKWIVVVINSSALQNNGWMITSDDVYSECSKSNTSVV